MEMAESMRSTAENIIGSYNVRVEALGDLVADTGKTLKGFAADRKKMASEQAHSLANFAKDLSKKVDHMLKGFHQSHKQMGEEQTKSLTHFIKNLTDDVGSVLSAFQKDRGKMSKELKNRLAKEVKGIETYIESRLKEFDETHTEMTQQQKKNLAKFVSEITSEVRKLLADYRGDMAGYRNDINKAAHAWKGMATTLAKARKGNPVRFKVEAGRGTTTAEEAVRGGTQKGRKKAKGKKR